jgi:hypothetical protein
MCHTARCGTEIAGGEATPTTYVEIVRAKRVTAPRHCIRSAASKLFWERGTRTGFSQVYVCILLLLLLHIGECESVHSKYYLQQSHRHTSLQIPDERAIDLLLVRTKVRNCTIQSRVLRVHDPVVVTSSFPSTELRTNN